MARASRYSGRPGARPIEFWRAAVGAPILVACFVLLASGCAGTGAPTASDVGIVEAPNRAQAVTAGDPGQRAAELVARMTLDEKITELHGIQDAEHRRFVPGIPRLGIPPLVITNGPAGVGPGDAPSQLPATALPAPIALAASFDRGLAHHYGEIIGEEARALGASLLEGPDVNVARVPLNGRTFEAFGEDPFLISAIAVPVIDGIQQQGVIAEVKHFAANNQEANRFEVDARIDDRTLHEIYLPHFEAAVRAGHAAAVMCAYPRVNGVFACENGDLLDGVLREQWGFDGFVQSDFGATHSTVASALAGLDLEMPTGRFYGDAMRVAVKSGELDERVIDTLLERRFATMMRLGLFDAPVAAPIDEAAGAALAREAAEQGSVLLKNAGRLLPLDSSEVTSIGLIGPGAGAARTGGGGSSHVVPLHTVEPMDGMQRRVGPNITVRLAADGSIDAAVEVARTSDVVVVMVGDDETEGRDRPGLVLGDDQDGLVEGVAAANPKTIVVVKSGGPVLMPWLDRVAAVLEVWYPGQEDGDVVAALLFGDAEPAGRLPVTFPRADGDGPASTPEQYPGVDGVAVYSEGPNVGYRWYDGQGIEPLFPFGYGLSYTSFCFSNLAVSPESQPDGRVQVSFDVTNTGARAGAEVAQVYLAFPPQAGEPPKQLKGFEKVWLDPGQTRRIALALDKRAFSIWDSASQQWALVPGSYDVLVGPSSRDLPLRASVTIG